MEKMKKNRHRQNVFMYEEELLGFSNDFNKPKIARIEYQEGEIVLEDYTELDKYLEQVLIPNYLKISHDGDDFLGSVFFIYLSDIVRLNFNTIEVKHIIEFLAQKGIQVRGTSSFLESVSSNYVYSSPPLYLKLNDSDALSLEEQQELFKKYSVSKDIAIRNKLVLANLKLVLHVLGKLKLSNKIDAEELISYGVEGLIVAIERFNPDFGTRFSSFACLYIKGYILREIREKYPFSNPVYEAFFKAKKRIEKEKMVRFEEEETLMDDILNLMYETTNLDPKNREIYKRQILSMYSISLEDMEDKELIDEGELYLHVDYEIFRKQFEKLLLTLNEKELEIVSLYYGLSDGEGLKTSEIAELKNITKQRVSQILSKARQKLRALEDIEAVKELGYEEIFSSSSRGEFFMAKCYGEGNTYGKRYRKE